MAKGAAYELHPSFLIEVWRWGVVYLEPAEYARFGLSEDVGEETVVAASAMIDAHCRRPSLGVEQYTERVRTAPGSCTVRLSATPLLSIVSARVRLGHANRMCVDAFADAVAAFGLSGSWMDVVASDVSFLPSGEVSIANHVLGAAYDEAEIVYTAGWNDVPDAVKVACAQMVRNAQAMPALNVKRTTLDAMQMEYFSGSLLDAETKSLLKPFVAVRIG